MVTNEPFRKKFPKENGKSFLKKKKGQEIPLWLVDGTVGVLALLIYNFLLYLLKNIGGIFSQLENSMGYFGLNSFLDFGFNAKEMFLGILIFFIVSFFLGTTIGSYLRKKGKRNKR